MRNWASCPDTVPDDERGIAFKFLVNDPEEFSEYLGWKLEYDEHYVDAKERDRSNTICADDKRSEKFKPMDDPDSCWGHYKRVLEKNDFKNIAEIEASSCNVGEMLKIRTESGSPCKGAVIGNVQSGKTANMEAIISMAADYGWNVFIVLSGLISNLREQTSTRMLTELRRDIDDPEDRTYNFDWRTIDPLKKAGAYKKENGAMILDSDSRTRYLSICLKNITHLKNLIAILDTCGRSEDMNLLIIDDEADQASVNANKKARSRINKLIIDLVYGKNVQGETKKCPFKSVNYLCYTATPYAILLNESDAGGKETLYPGDYIFALTPSDLYIGVNRIFSKEDTALSNKIVILDDHISDSVSDLKTHPEWMPESMKDAVCWFICCVAIRRHRKAAKPVSMMLNIDFQRKEHDAVDEAIVYYLKNCKDDIRDRCRRQYDIQTEFTVADFRRMVPDYGGGEVEIDDYPKYSEIEGYVDVIIRDEPTRIRLKKDESGEVKRVYDSRINICVDNCENNVDAINGEDFFTGRLSYPSEKDESTEKTPAFIVIGGNTLSRGLTIEGLVVSYFRRTVKQADTLLQMGRWFGFRKGYELLPRIWMDSKAKEAFETLNEINEAMIAKISEYKDQGVTPRDYAVRIMDIPESQMLKSLTAKNKMRGARPVNYGGGSDKYISKYCKSKEDLEYNLDSTRDFLNAIPHEKVSEYRAPNTGKVKGYLFKRVDKQAVINYLTNFKRETEKTWTSGDACIKWMKKVADDIDSFNVLLSGNTDPVKEMSDGPTWTTGKYTVYKVTRTCIDKDNSMFIKTPRDKQDLLADIDIGVLEQMTEKERADLLKIGDAKMRINARKKSGWSKIPLVVLNIANNKNEYPADIVTVTMLIPPEINKNTEVEGNFLYLDDSL